MAVKAKKTQTLPFLLSLLSTTLFLLLPAISAVDQSDPSNTNYTTDFIRTSCNATLYPDVCFTSLSAFADVIQQSPSNLARVAIGVSLSRARRMAAHLSNLLRQTNSDPETVAVLRDCSTTFGDAIDQMRRSKREMHRLNLTTTAADSLGFQMSNVQTWMSASLTNEDTCTDGFDDVPDGPMKSDVCGRVGNVRKFASNALALVNSFVASVVNATVTP